MVDENPNVAEFLRSARARLSPTDVGLSHTALRARRVKGLRRDEVAGLAGISMEYYTRIEQGRVGRASDAVINGLAAALRLSETERSYLFELLAASTGGSAPQRKRSRRVLLLRFGSSSIDSATRRHSSWASAWKCSP